MFYIVYLTDSKNSTTISLSTLLILNYPQSINLNYLNATKSQYQLQMVKTYLSSGVNRIHSGQESGSWRRTQRLNIMLRQNQSFVGQSVDVRTQNIRIVKADIVEAYKRSGVRFTKLFESNSQNFLHFKMDSRTNDTY